MPLEEDINAFRMWATSLGCPPEAIPNEESLISIFKSRQRELFSNLMKRVQPQQKVKEIREKLLIVEMEQCNTDVPPQCRSVLPKKFQLYLRINDLKKRKKDLEMLLEERKRDYDKLAATIKTKNMKSINLEDKLKLQARVNLLEFKSKSLDEELKEEAKVKERIIATMPVKLTEQNVSETNATQAVQNVLSELDLFYSFCESTNNSQELQSAREELWQKVRSIFTGVPNFTIFNAIMRMKEEQLQHIVSFRQVGVDSHSSSSSLGAGGLAKEPLSQFDLKILQAKTDILGLVTQYIAGRNKRIVLEKQFTDKYAPFVDALQKKIMLFNADTEEQCDEVISDYLVQFNLRNFKQAQNDHLQQQIEVFKKENEIEAKHLENHEVLLGSIKQVYSDINASVNRVHHELLQLTQIKEKIIYSKNMMIQMLQKDVQMAASRKPPQQSNLLPIPAVLINGCSDSFELGSDDVFCSTKLDFDATMTTPTTSKLLNNTMMSQSFNASSTASCTALLTAGDGRLSLPPHLTELNLFAEIPLAQFSCVPRECAIYLSPNPFVVASRELTSNMQLAPGLLLNPFGALQEVQNRILWAESIAVQSKNLKFDFEMMMVDPLELKQRAKQQREFITELLDKTAGIDVNTEHVLRKIAKLYDFELKNPLRHCIPASKCFRNQTYADYEAEFMLYYRMTNK